MSEGSMASTHRLAGDAVTAMDVVRKWHSENHPSSFELCMEQPCHAIQRVSK